MIEVNNKSDRHFMRPLSRAARSFGLRATARYLHPRYEAFNTELERLPTIGLSRMLAKSVRRGVQPDFDDSGEIVVLKTMQLKHGHIDLADAERVTTEFAKRNRRAMVRFGDLVISSTGEGRGKIDLYEDESSALADSHVSIVSLSDVYDPRFAVHFLRTKFGAMQIAQLEMAVKGTPELYRDQISCIRLLKIPKETQCRISQRIKAIESGIAALKVQLRTPEDTVNEIMCEEFEYPVREHYERARTKAYKHTLADMAHAYTLRSSTKFHHPDFELTEQFFSRTPHVRVKALVAVPIRLGATASKGDFVEDGAAYYVHPGATKRQNVIVREDCYQVNEEFYESARRRFNLRMDDIVLNRAGEGTIGKSGLWASEEPALFSDFTMRLRLTEHVNPRFVWYFFRSVMFQAQIEREKRGMGNMTNIFPPEVERMLIVDCDRAQQDSIARAIDEELARLDALRAGIEAKRQEIDRLIDDAVRGAGAHS